MNSRDPQTDNTPVIFSNRKGEEVSETVETQWGYRVTEVWGDEGDAKTYTSYHHEVGAGLFNQKFAERKVKWLNENYSGFAEVISRTVTYTDWEVKR